MQPHPSLSIGEFSCAAHLSVKTLRHYHPIGLLEPAEVDADTGYRRYSIEQIPTAQVIRRFRDLDMPLDLVHAVLAAPDVHTRNSLITSHLRRLEDGLARTQDAVSSLRDLLEDPSPSGSFHVSHRSVTATPAAAISEIVDLEDALAWHHGALGELYATLAAQDALAAGPAGGIFANDLFSHERGQSTVFIPYVGIARPLGRVTTLVVPGTELATTVHIGAHTGIDRAYGAIATHVTQHALAVDGPVREYYLVGRHDTADESQWRTEVGWPIFQTTTDRP